MEKIKEAFPDFAKPSIAVDTVLLRVREISDTGDKQIIPKRLQVLLVRKHGENMWHLPGTIVRLGETSKDAISRYVDTNNMYLEQLYAVDNNVFRDERGHIISIVYIGVVTDDIVVSDNFEAKWFWIEKENDTFERIYSSSSDDYKCKELMYDHNTIIDDTLKKIKEKLKTSNIGFKFIGDKFTWRELENTFNAVNENPIPAFRRLMGDRLTSTGEISTGKSYRPAELFTLKK